MIPIICRCPVKSSRNTSRVGLQVAVLIACHCIMIICKYIQVYIMKLTDKNNPRNPSNHVLHPIRPALAQLLRRKDLRQQFLLHPWTKTLSWISLPDLTTCQLALCMLAREWLWALSCRLSVFWWWSRGGEDGELCSLRREFGASIATGWDGN